MQSALLARIRPTFAAERLPDCLMPQAHPEYRQLTAQLLDHGQGDAGVIGVPGARREQHSRGFGLADLLHSDTVVQSDIALAAEGLDVLDQVVRKGVVVIDDHDTLFHARKRCTRARAGQWRLA